MRFLDFVASGQILQRDQRCDFSGIAAGSRGYLYARFRFTTKDWSGSKRVAVFTYKGKEYPAPLQFGQCEAPEEVLHGGPVQVHLVGLRSDGVKITTGRTAFTVNR